MTYSFAPRLALAVLSLACVPRGYAQTVLPAPARLSGDSLGLPEAVVVAYRSPEPLQSLGHTYDVLTQAELATLPITSTAEALSYVAGLDLRQRGPRGVQADLSIRGGTFDQVLVLLNGVKLADPQTGHHALYVPVPLENVERIEVLKGPGARLYGQNAFAGAINIVTRPGAAAGTELRAAGGQYGAYGFGVSLDLPTGPWRQTLSLQREGAAGYREGGAPGGELRHNTDADIATGWYQAELTAGRSRYGLMAGLVDRAFGANGFYASASATEQYEEVTTGVLALTQEREGRRGQFSQRLAWRRNQDEYVFIRDNPSVYRNLHISHTVGYDAYQSLDNPLGRLGVGAEVQGVWLESNLLGARSRLVANATVEQSLDLGDRLRVVPGATLNYLTDAGARLLPGLDLRYVASESVTAYANAGATWRVPTYTDLYYEDRFNEGNPDLVPERAYAVEAGVRMGAGVLRAEAAVWHRRATDLIDYVRDSPADTVWQPRNFAEAEFTGVEAEVQLRRPALWLPSLRVNYALVDATLPEDSGEIVSRYALDHLRHQVSAVVVLRVAEWLTATPTLRVADRVTTPAQGAPPADYALLDLRLDFRPGERGSLFAEVTNLLDERYGQANGVPLAGRWVRAGGRFRLR